MPREDDIGTEQPSRTGVRILRANNVEIPITEQSQAQSEAQTEFAKLRSAFIAGEKLEPEQLTMMMSLAMQHRLLQSNCGIC